MKESKRKRKKKDAQIILGGAEDDDANIGYKTFREKKAKKARVVK